MTAVPPPKPPTPEGLAAITPSDEALSWAQDLAELYARKGAHQDYKKFADSTVKQTTRDAFTFISDACESEGGFADGTYLDPHTRETARQVAAYVSAMSGSAIASGPGLSVGLQKYDDRKKIADYDNFARTIRDAAWGHISQSKDLIHRESIEPALTDFWKNADGHGGSMDDFNEEPQQQAQMFGYAIVVVDRPDVPIANAADEAAPENQPYCYTVPSKNVVRWKFDDDGELAAIAFLEPKEDDEGKTAQTTDDLAKAPMRVWTRECWALFERTAEAVTEGEDHYTMMDWGPNPLGRVPVEALYYDRPKAGKLMGKSIMRDVALLNKTVFNQDSEIRELERLLGFPIFCIPTKNPGSVKGVVVGAGTALGYNASAGEPRYVSADPAWVETLRASREKKKESAFSMAHLAAIIGHVETTSGFHSEAEFEKTNKRIGRNASALEDFETRIAKLFLRWKGYSEEQINDTEGLVQITYPKSFQIRDLDQLIKRTTDELEMGLGDDANRRFLKDFFTALWPRMQQEEMEKLVESAAKEVTGLTESAVSGGVAGGGRAKVATIVKLGLKKGQPSAGAQGAQGNVTIQ